MNTNKFSEKEFAIAREILGLEEGSATVAPHVELLEEDLCNYFGGGYAIAMNSGTSTLHSALLALGVGEGDEVISPAFTVIMNTAVTLQVGATPVYVDVLEDRYTMDPIDLERKITSKTKAIQVVSVYGLSPEYDEIMAVANKHGIPVIEDNAECIGGMYKGKLVGTFGLFNSLSFEDTKHISCFEGGALLTKCPWMAERARKFAGHGFRTLSAKSGKVRLNPEEWMSPDFERHVIIGYNYRLTSLQAGIARVQLERLESELLFWRVKSGMAIESALSSTGLFKIQNTPDYVKHSYWAVGARFTGSKEKWFKFRDLLFEHCGERVFGAWRVPYKEPVIRDHIYKRVSCFSGRDSVNIGSIGTCPTAERIQGSMMVFKTKYRNEESLNNLINGIYYAAGNI